MNSNRIKTGIVFLLVTQLFYTCSSDDDPKNDGNILGTWKMTSMDYEGEASTEVQGFPVTTTFDAVGKNLDVTMTFTESPNEFSTSGSYDVEISFSFLGQTESQTETVDNFDSEGTWSRSDDKLMLDGSMFSLSIPDGTGLDDISSGELTIKELDETTLRLSMKVTEEFTQGGSDVSATVTSTLEFTRE